MNALRISRKSMTPGRTAVACLLAMVVPCSVQAQTGAFHLGTPPSTARAEIQTIPTTRLWVDANGSILDDADDTHHPVPPGINSGWDLSLSPSRRILVARLGNPTDCVNDVIQLRLFKIPRSDHSLTELGSQQSLRCLLQTYYDDADTTAPFRSVAFVSASMSDPGTRQILWWNLVSGESGVSAGAFNSPFGDITYSPSGTMGSVKSDLNNIAGPSYTPVKLCPTGIGQAAQNGFQSTETLHATVEAGTPDLVVTYRNDSDVLRHSVGYEDCAVANPLGACCLPAGGCQPTTQGGCPGTWSANVPCASAGCPFVALEASMTGPASAPRGSFVTYTLTARNTGTLTANAVTLVDRIPSGSAFQSASGGGSFSAATQSVTWSLGTLAGGAQTTRTLTVVSPCSGFSLLNSVYSISGTPGGTVSGSPAVTTTLTAPSTAGLSLTTSSIALATPPLLTGDRVRHTVHIANGGPNAYDSLAFSLNAGTSSDIVQLNSGGGGNVLWTASSLSWKGNVPIGASLDVVYETAIRECRSTQPTTEVLNRANVLTLRNSCFVTLASVTPSTAFAVSASPFRVTIESPSHGPVQWWGSPDFNRMVACRPGSTVDLELRYTNFGSAQSPTTALSMPLPLELSPVGDPPYVGLPPAGTTWSSGTRTLGWSGQVASGDSVAITVRVQMNTVDCSSDISAFGGFGVCPSGLFTELSVLAVPVPPASHLLSVHNSNGLRFRESAGAAGWTPLLCGRFEDSRGFGRTADGTIWVAGLPCFRLNPYSLSFQILPPTFPASLGMDDVHDVAEDPRDSSLVFSGFQTGLGLRVRRYQPRTGVASVILDDTSPQSLGAGKHVTVSTDGIIGVNVENSLLRVDPAIPAAYQRFFAPGNVPIVGLALDLDGHWLTTTKPANLASPRWLSRVDRNTGTFSNVFDLGPHFTWFYRMSGLAAAPDSDVWLGTNGDQFGVLHRSPTMSVQGIPETLANVDLLWVGGGPTDAASDPAIGQLGGLRLSAAMPNPTRGSTTLRFVLPRAGMTTLELFDSQGRRLRTLTAGPMASGAHVVRWDGADGEHRAVPAGVYFVRLQWEGESRRIRVALTR